MTTDSHEQLLRERKQAWWTSVLAGPIDQPYPSPGATVAAHLDGDVLVIEGSDGTVSGLLIAIGSMPGPTPAE
jgi:hypothetical protein